MFTICYYIVAVRKGLNMAKDKTIRVTEEEEKLIKIVREKGSVVVIQALLRLLEQNIILGGINVGNRE